ncbi:MAG: hypothetical protein AAF549_06860 [Pseudomonadota bacterium]
MITVYKSIVKVLYHFKNSDYRRDMLSFCRFTIICGLISFLMNSNITNAQILKVDASQVHLLYYSELSNDQSNPRSVSFESFRKQIEYLKDSQVQFLSFDTIQTQRRKKTPKSVILLIHYNENNTHNKAIKYLLRNDIPFHHVSSNTYKDAQYNNLILNLNIPSQNTDLHRQFIFSETARFHENYELAPRIVILSGDFRNKEVKETLANYKFDILVDIENLHLHDDPLHPLVMMHRAYDNISILQHVLNRRPLPVYDIHTQQTNILSIGFTIEESLQSYLDHLTCFDHKRTPLETEIIGTRIEIRTPKGHDTVSKRVFCTLPIFDSNNQKTPYYRQISFEN